MGFWGNLWSTIRGQRRPAPEQAQNVLEAKKQQIQQQQAPPVPTPDSQYNDAVIDVRIKADKRIDVADLQMILGKMYPGSTIKIYKDYERKAIDKGEAGRILDHTDLDESYKGFGNRIIHNLDENELQDRDSFHRAISKKVLGYDETGNQQKVTNEIFDWINGG